jgi:hypothetical protein
MTSSHDSSSAPQGAISKLLHFIQARQKARPVSDLEQFERDVRALVMEVEREVVATELARLDVDVPVVEIDGVPHQQVLRCEQSYFGASGEIRVMRSLYSTRNEGTRTSCPLELRAGIVEGRWTPLAAKQAIWAVAHLTPQESEELFRTMGGMTPSKSSLDRLPKLCGLRWEEERLHFEEKLREAQPVPERAVTVAISLDGVMLPMKDGARAEKRARATARGAKLAGPAGYQEAGCGTISFIDAQGERISTIRLARMPESKKETLKCMLRDELDDVLRSRPELRLVKIADGARDNWTFFRELPKGTEIVDFYHAAEHLNAALIAAYGETSPKGRGQFVKLRHLLRHDPKGVDKVITALRHLRAKHPRRERIGTELKYFTGNRKRMRYKTAADRGLPIGSGVVEAACKTLVTQRMKRSGMRWREAGGQAILTFRALVQSERFDHGWTLLAGTYRHTVKLPGNAVEFRPRVAA